MAQKIQVMKLVGVAMCVAQLVGCASSMTGYESESKLTCSAANNGLPCTSMSEVYKASNAGRLPGQISAASGAAPVIDSAAALPVDARTAQHRKLLDSGTPVRTPPRVLRALIFPWEDASGVFSDQKLIYLTVDSGRWMLEHNQRAVTDAFAPTRLRQGPASGAGTSGTSGTPKPNAPEPRNSGLFLPPTAQPNTGR